MKDLVARYTSRKFLATVGTSLVLIANSQWGELVTLVLGYVAVEGGADFVERLKGGVSTLNGYVNPTSQNDETGVDTSKVVTGKPTPTPLFNEEVKE